MTEVSPPSMHSRVGLRNSSNAFQLEVKRAYELISAEYTSRRQRDGADDLLDILIDRTEHGTDVIDLGCGGGKPVTRELTDHFNVVGVDISRRQSQLAKQNAPDATIINSDVTQMNFKNRTYSAAVMYYSLVNIPRERHQGLLKDIYRALVPGGIVLFSTGRGSHEHKTRQNWLGTGEPMYWSHYATRRYKQLLRRIGYRVEETFRPQHQIESSKSRRHPFILARK